MTSQPIFLNTKLPSSKEGRLALFHRWENYGLVLASQTSSKPKMIVVPVIPSHLPENPNLFPNLRFIPTRHNSFATLRVLNLVRKLLTPSSASRYLLVSGITPVDMIAAVLFKSLLKNKVGLQGQFHGNTYHFTSRFSIVAFGRSLISRLLIRFSDSIRVVSDFQVGEIIQISRKDADAFIVAPIPIDSNMIAKSPVEKNRKLIAVVGRLHAERGLLDIIHIVGKLCTLGIDVEIEIAGDGPLRPSIERLVRRFPTRIKFWGHCDSKLLSDLYGRSSFLLSAAQSEGYGMALREAIFNDVRVVAKKSMGANSLKGEFREHVYLYESAASAVEILVSLLTSTEETSIPELSFSDQELRDTRRIQLLVESWHR